MTGLTFSDLSGWMADDHAAALAAFLVTSDLWPAAGTLPAPVAPTDARAWFETHFIPVEVGREAAHFTGYYEPELSGSLAPSLRYPQPLYAPPPMFDPACPWASRSEIVAGDLLSGRELVWVESTIEAFLAQVQGSVRIRLDGGATLRLGYAGKNGHPYRSIGAELVRRGEVAPSDITPATIRAWCAANPDQVQTLLNHNPSFVFFQQMDLSETSGPLGAMGRPVTPLRSLAVDPAHIALGSPVWVECRGLPPRLMIAQDTGSAIRGARRGDIFFGSGPAAGAAAGAVNDAGRMLALVPRR